MFLEVVSLSWDIGRNLHTIGEADAGNLTDSGVRLSRGLGGHLGADATLERRRVKRRTILECVKTARKRRLTRLRRFVLTSFLGQLIDGGHLEKEDPRWVSRNIKEYRRECNLPPYFP